MGLIDRVKKLEIVQADVCPLPGLVRIVSTPEEEAAAIAEQATMPPGTPLVLVQPVNSRREVKPCL